jgi:hypothetical protein
MVERFVHRVTTALRPGSDALRINLRMNDRSFYRVNERPKLFDSAISPPGKTDDSSLPFGFLTTARKQPNV